MLSQNKNITDIHFNNDEYRNQNFDDLECQEHQMRKKYWSPEFGNFFCEHDNIDSKNMVHFRFILDKYSEDINILKQTSSLIHENNSNNLSNIYFNTNNIIERNFNLINSFKNSFEIFANSFINNLFKTTVEDKEINDLKDLIKSIKFDDQGKADFIGIGTDREREKNYIKLAKILIFRNVTNKSLFDSLLNFLNHFQEFLICLTNDSSNLIEYFYNDLLKEICKVEGKNYENKYQVLKSPIVLREELTKFSENVLYYINLNNTLNLKITNLEGELNNQKFNYEKIFSNLKTEILESKNSYLFLEKQKNDLQLRLDGYLNQIHNYESIINNNQITIEKNNQLISDLKNEIQILKENQQNQDLVCSEQNDENSRIREMYENKLNEMDSLIAKDLETINNLNKEIQKYDFKVKELEQKILSLQNSLLNDKNNFEDAKNEYLNIIENDKKSISDLNTEIILISEKLRNYASSIEALKNEKQQWEEFIEGNETYKIELQWQMKQNELLNTRIEELEKIMSISKEKTEQNTVIINKFNDYKPQFDELFIQRELLEKELLEKKNKISQLQLQIDSTNIKNESFNAELFSLKEQIKIIPNLQNSIKVLSIQLEEANNAKSKQEMENTELKNKISKQSIETEQLKYKIIDYEMTIEKLKMEINQLRNYEKKLEILSNSKMEIDKLKNRLEQDRLNSSVLEKSSPRKINQNLLPGISPSDFYNKYNLSQDEINENENFGKNLNESQTEKKSFKTFNSQYERNFVDENKVNSKNSFTPISQKNLQYNGTFDKLNSSESLKLVANGNSNTSSQNLLLNQNHWSIIKGWLGALNIANSKRVNLNLIMKASRDGFSAGVFKKKCHKKGPTLVVALTSHDKLIGGFTPLAWNSGDFNYVADVNKKTFLFSLTNGKYYLLSNAGYAICHGNDIGPIFGGGSDLEIVSNCNKKYNNFSGFGHSFETDENADSFYGGKKYLVKDYEVYEVNY